MFRGWVGVGWRVLGGQGPLMELAKFKVPFGVETDCQQLRLYFGS